MPRGRCDQFRFLGINPFKLKGHVFLAAVPEDTGSGESADENPNNQAASLAPHEERSREAQEAAMKFFNELPKNRQAYGGSKAAFAMEKQREDLLARIRAIQRIIDGIEPLRKRFEASIIGSEEARATSERAAGRDLNEDNWLRDLEAAKELQRQFDQINLPGMNISKETFGRMLSNNAEERKSATEEYLRGLGNHAIGLERGRKQAEDELKTLMREEFQARLAFAKSQWQTKVPTKWKDKPGVVEGMLKAIDETATALQSIGNDRPLSEYQEVWEELDRLEGVYAGDIEVDNYHAKYAEEKGETLSFETLRKKAGVLEEIRRQSVARIQENYNTERDKTLSLLQAVLVKIETPEEDVDKEKARQKFVAEIQERIDELNQNKDFDALTHAALYSDESMEFEGTEMGTDGKPIKKTRMIDGRPVPKGLAKQIDFLEGHPTLDEHGKLVTIQALDEALDRLGKDFENPATFTSHMKAMQTQASNYINSFDNLIGGGGAWSVQWFAPMDLQKVWSIASEWTSRRLERSRSKRVGQFGRSTLGFLNNAPWPLKYFNTLPSDYNKEVENAEQGEVQKYKDAYGNKDLWDVLGILYRSRDLDEFKACMFLLTDAGRIRWDDQRLLKQLNYFQGSVQFSMNMNVHYMDLSAYYDKLNIAFTAMYDADTFKGFFNSNISNYEGKKNGFTEACNSQSESEGGLRVMLDGQLKNWRESMLSGATPNFDPLFYEKIIDYSIERGKLGSEEKMYYLIQGIAMGILPQDRGAVLDGKYLNNYPPLEFFTSDSPGGHGSRPTMEDFKEIALMNKGEFNDYFHNHIMQLPKVKERANKAITQPGVSIDHDDLTAIAPAFDIGGIKTLLKRNTDGKTTIPVTGLANTATGLIAYLHNYAHHSTERDTGRDDLKRLIGSFTAYEAILNGRMYKNQELAYFRLDPIAARDKPRASGAYSEYGIPDMSWQAHLDTMKDYMKVLDSEYFSFLYDSTKTDRDVPEFVNALAARWGVSTADIGGLFGGKVPQTMDNLFDSTAAYVDYIFQKNPSAIDAMLAKINERNQLGFKAKTDSGGKDLPTLHQNWQARKRYASENYEEASDSNNFQDTYVQMLIQPDQYEDLT